MNSNTEITSNIINTINMIFQNLFQSIDDSLYGILDDLVFIDSGILQDKYLMKIFGTSSTNGILLISNSLLIGFFLYYAIRYMMNNLIYIRIESPSQFIFKSIIFGICMNSSFFIIEQILNLDLNVCSLIRNIGEDLFGKKICFTNLINEININLSMDKKDINIFTLDGIIKGTLTVSLLNLIFSYSLRYVMIKIFVLIAPFSFLSLMLENTSHFFKSWYKNLFSLLFIQIIVSIVLLLLFAMDYSKGNLINKFIYIGGIYALIRANSIVREFVGGVSINVQTGISNLKLSKK